MKGIDDLIVYGKILSTGILIGGYAFLGVLGARYLVKAGYPEWLNVALPLLTTVFGIYQGWMFIRETLRKK